MVLWRNSWPCGKTSQALLDVVVLMLENSLLEHFPRLIRCKVFFLMHFGVCDKILSIRKYFTWGWCWFQACFSCISELYQYFNAFWLKTFVSKHIHGVIEIKELPLVNSHIREILKRVLDFFPVLILNFIPHLCK